MELKSQACHLRDFITHYAPMWSNEIMNEYPESMANYPVEWIHLLETLGQEELFAIDCKKIIPEIKGTSFELFMQKAIEVSFIETIPETPEIPLEDWAFFGVKKKKRHEIQKIVPKLKKIKDEIAFDYVVDIGGGVGHLSRVLSHYHSIASISLDQNAEFQKIGKERLLKFRKLDGARDVQFINLTFGQKGNEALLKNVFRPQSFSLGLHTCGPLANRLIENSIDHKTKGLLSFGCCYHRLNPETDFPLSDFYKENHFPKLNLFALSLATRSHAQMDFEVYKTKERVKYYRYALHLFLMKHFNNKYFTDVGECPIKTYWGPFSLYIKSKLSELKLEHHFGDEYFENFYHDPFVQRQLRKMWIANIIRWILGRPLEVYLLIDRALYLQEKGYEVTIEQYFTESLSPRNIGILAFHHHLNF